MYVCVCDVCVLVFFLFRVYDFCDVVSCCSCSCVCGYGSLLMVFWLRRHLWPRGSPILLTRKARARRCICFREYASHLHGSFCAGTARAAVVAAGVLDILRDMIVSGNVAMDEAARAIGCLSFGHGVCLGACL